MRLFLSLFVFFFSFSLQAEESVEKKYPSNELIVKVFQKNNNEYKDIDINNLNLILNKIDSNEFHTKYKKHLLKNLSMLNYKAFVLSENDEELKNIAKYIFPTSMCAAYQFRDDLVRLLNESANVFVKDELSYKKYQKAFNKMGDLYLNKATENFIPDEEFFLTKCSK